jgi:hypothetical protein
MGVFEARRLGDSLWGVRILKMPVYKSDWTDANSAENAITYFLDVHHRRRSKERLAPFQVERLDFRAQDLEGFYQALERNGPKAVREFKAAFG